MIFLIITNILLLGVSVYLGYRVWYLAGIVGDIQEQTDEYINTLEHTNEYMYNRIVQSYDNIKRIDLRGAFAAEDEVGTTFDMLKEIIESLKEEFDGSSKEEK